MDLSSVKRLEDGGAAAVVLHSLFEEQIRTEASNLEHFLEHGTEAYAEALSYFPAQETYVLGPDEYIDHVRACKEALGIPVVGSLNGVSAGGWTEYAGLIEQAGADAIELNIYYLPTDPRMTSEDVEQVYLDVLRDVKGRVKIPVAVKMGPFISSLANFAGRLQEAGADGLSLFNRFYLPDIDLEELEVSPTLDLSTSVEALVPLRWIAILREHLSLTITATTGVHAAEDALKLVMAGADTICMCSALLREGPGKLAEVRDGMAAWLEEHEYESLAQARGSMSQSSCPEPAAWLRANFVKTVHSYR